MKTSPLMLIRAHKLAMAFGHLWGLALDRQFQTVGSQLTTKQSPWRSWACDTVHVIAKRFPASRWQELVVAAVGRVEEHTRPGEWAPRFGWDGCRFTDYFTHTTGSRRSHWKIFADGEVFALVSRPQGDAIWATVYPDGDVAVRYGHVAIEERHYEALEQMVSAVLGRAYTVERLKETPMVGMSGGSRARRVA